MILATALLLAEAAPAASGMPITMQIHNVRNSHGRLRVSVCPRERFLADGCEWHATAPAQSGTTTIIMPGVPAGDYAVQAFHDENDNDRIDRGMFGIPKEGVGFSRDARIVFGPPAWRDAEFSHGREPQTISFSLRYFAGPGSAAEWRKRHPAG